jgi:urease accessory protein
MAPDASLTICEALVFGRAAMGERLSCGLLRDHWRIRRDGKLVFAEALSLDGAIGKILAGPAVAGDAGAVATIVQASVAAESKIEALRSALRAWETGASAFDGLLVVRLLANDGLALRSAILAALPALGMTPPRAFTL